MKKIRTICFVLALFASGSVVYGQTSESTEGKAQQGTEGLTTEQMLQKNEDEGLDQPPSPVSVTPAQTTEEMLLQDNGEADPPVDRGTPAKTSEEMLREDEGRE